MRKIVRIASLLPILLLSGHVSADGWQKAVGVESFNWYEYDPDGSELVHESGPRLFVEFSSSREYTKRINASYSGRLYGANVRYDGETQSGIPITTNSLYLGFALEAMFDYRLSINGDSFSNGGDWFLTYGLGYEGWLRGIRDTSTASGYNEFYRVPYTRLGLSFDANDQTRIQFGAKFPMLVREYVVYSRFVTDDTGEKFADLELAPVARATLYASIDFTMAENWNFRLYYDRYLFDASPKESLLTASGNPVYCFDGNSDGVCDALNAINSGSDSETRAYQPHSEHQTIGVRFTLSF